MTPPGLLGKFLVIMGIALVLVGFLLIISPRIPWLGHLPGDIHYSKRRSQFSLLCNSSGARLARATPNTDLRSITGDWRGVAWRHGSAPLLPRTDAAALAAPPSVPNFSGCTHQAIAPPCKTSENIAETGSERWGSE